MSFQATIFVVDPDASSRNDVKKIAENMGMRTAAYENGEDFLAAYEENRSGCLVSEIRLLGMSGLELQESMAANCISLPLVFITRFAETRLTVKAMQTGALTVLEKPVSSQELWDAVSKALAIDRETRRVDAAHHETRRRLAQMTKKEWQVLEMLIEGKTNKVIANRLGVSVRTVEARRRQIFKKTETDSVAELVRLIVQTDMVK
jgi:FixJ family two-component response regulator